MMKITNLLLLGAAAIGAWWLWKKAKGMPSEKGGVELENGMGTTAVTGGKLTSGLIGSPPPAPIVSEQQAPIEPTDLTNGPPMLGGNTETTSTTLSFNYGLQK